MKAAVLSLGGVDLVTVHGKLEWEALEKMDRSKEEGDSLKGRKLGVGRRFLEDRMVVV